MAFNDATRREVQQMPDMNMAAGGGNTLRLDLPRVGILSHVYLAIRGTVVNTGTAATGPNRFGYSGLIRNVRLSANNGNDIFNVSGPGYHYLLRPMLELGDDPLPQSTGRTPVVLTAGATTPVNLDMIIPVAINLRDPIGLIMLQSDQTLLTLQVTFESIANMQAANAGAWTFTVTPYIVFFTVPAQRSDWPSFNLIHQIIEDTQVVPAAGTLVYNWPRGDIYIQTAHGLGFAAAAATDNFSQVQLRMQQTTYLQNTNVPFLDIENNFINVQTLRLPGTIPFNFMGTTGLGVYDLTRDTIDSSQLTDLATVITALGPDTLYTVRRQLVPLQPSAAPSGAR